MKSTISLVAAVLLVLLTSPVDAADQTTSGKSYVSESKAIVYANQIKFESKLLDETMPINVYLPESFYEASDEHTYPVIFINGSHGNQFFHTLTGIVKHLSGVERMPESIVVSLNYSGHFPEVNTNQMWKKETITGYGQPALYLRHLKEELFPYLKQHYRANEHRTLIGVSGSALFPLYIMTQDIQLFESYVLLAAMDVIGMRFQSGTTIIDDLTDALRKPGEQKTFFYMGLADDDIALKKHDKYRSNLNKLEQQLSPLQSKAFEYKIDVIDNERHYDAFIKAMLAAIDMMYPESQWAPKYRDLIAQPGDALDNIDAFYTELSKVYGFPILPRADRWNSVNCLRFITGMLRREGRIKESIRVAKRWVEYRPQSAYAHSELAQSLEKNRQFEQAIEEVQKAIKLAQASKDYYLEDYQAQLTSLKQKR